MREEPQMNQLPLAFWSIPQSEMLQELKTSKEGLTSAEAKQRLAFHGANLLESKNRSDVFTLLFSQFKSPIILILMPLRFNLERAGFLSL